MSVEFYNKEFPEKHYVKDEYFPSPNNSYASYNILYKADNSCDIVVHKEFRRRTSYGDVFTNEPVILLEDIIEFHVKNEIIIIFIDKNNNYHIFNKFYRQICGEGEITEDINNVLQTILSEDDLITGFLKIKKEDIPNSTSTSLYTFIDDIKSAIEAILDQYKITHNNEASLEHIRKIVRKIKTKLYKLNITPLDVDLLIDEL